MRLVLSLAILIAGAAQAEWLPPEATADEFQVNSHTPNDQRIPVLAADAAGNSVVIWQSRNQETQGWAVYAQRVDAAGELIGPEFRINQFNVGNQEGHHVQMQPDGRFLVVWHGPDRASAADATVIQQREFAADGQAITAEARVSEELEELQFLPRVGWAADGRRVVAWDGQAIVSDSFDVLRRRFDASAEPLGVVKLTNQVTTSAQRRAEVAMAPDGRYVVAWQSALQDGSDWGVFARCFSLDGAEGNEFLVNQTTLGAQARPRLAVAADGRFAVTWQDNRGLSSFDYQRVMVRQFGPDCQPLGDERQVNELDEGIQDLPAIGVDGDGHYVLAWQNFPPDFDDQGIYGRWLDRDGQFRGGAFRISQEVEAYQDYPAVQALPDGGLMATWETIGQDGSGFGIYARRLGAQRFVPPIEPLAVSSLGPWALLLLALLILPLARARLC